MNKGPVFKTINTKVPETKHICRCAVHSVVQYLFQQLTKKTKNKATAINIRTEGGHTFLHFTRRPEENTHSDEILEFFRNKAAEKVRDDLLFFCEVASYCPIRVLPSERS